MVVPEGCVSQSQVHRQPGPFSSQGCPGDENQMRFLSGQPQEPELALGALVPQSALPWRMNDGREGLSSTFFSRRGVWEAALLKL